MKKIYEELPIETWKEIAERIQKTNASKLSTKDFYLNLAILQKLLSDLDICLEAKKREPKCVEDIGISTLLHSVYETNGYWDLAKLDFREYIYKLEALGVKKLEFNPVKFPTKCNKKLEYEDNHIYLNQTISKCYTDGKFKINRPQSIINYKDYDRYVVTDIKNASFILYSKICHERPYALKEPFVMESNIILKDFNGKLPSHDELYKIEFPKLKAYSAKVNWGESPNYTQIYDEFTHEELEKVKKLTR